MLKRSCGVLMPIFSLPSKYGIGTLGKAAKKFVDFLVDAGQSYWQILPVGPTSYGDSPYQSFSTFAGNPYFIDLEALIADKLLTKKECDAPDWGDDPSKVDYAKIYNNRFEVLYKAYQRGKERDKAEFDAFCLENKSWLADYALYMAVKRHFGMKAWFDWEDKNIRLRKPDAIKNYTELLADDIDFFSYVQYLFFKQWDELKKYANEKGVGIIGDIPIYVAMDSADVWAEPQWFQLDDDNVPKEVAGVPPDYFSADGQLWGNPLYRWDKMEADGYGWWIRRIGGAQKLYDVLRIDHFRGIESYWAVPYGAKTARNGRWVKGPGMKLLKVLTDWFRDLQFIAEDLGILTPEVRELLTESGLPGMKVLEFAFDKSESSNYLPHVYKENCICYAGTHDNATLKEWTQTLDHKEIVFAKEYLGLNEKEGLIKGILRGGMSSVAALFIAQMQDWLELGAEARINTPGTPCGNWQWRMDADALSKALSKDMARMAVIYGRSDKPREQEKTKSF